jgi:hypothetical protein
VTEHDAGGQFNRIDAAMTAMRTGGENLARAPKGKPTIAYIKAPVSDGVLSHPASARLFRHSRAGQGL